MVFLVDFEFAPGDFEFFFGVVHGLRFGGFLLTVLAEVFDGFAALVQDVEVGGPIAQEAGVGFVNIFLPEGRGLVNVGDFVVVVGVVTFGAEVEPFGSGGGFDEIGFADGCRVVGLEPALFQCQEIVERFVGVDQDGDGAAAVLDGVLRGDLLAGVGTGSAFVVFDNGEVEWFGGRRLFDRRVQVVPTAQVN